jgi:hypothetical protein
MREYRDSSNRLSIHLSDGCEDFAVFSQRLESRWGPPREKVDGLEQQYWDFGVEGSTVVLHSDASSGVSIHVNDGSCDELLRRVAKELSGKSA